MKIKDSVILITGASMGIGRATAELLGREGAKVALAARSEDKLREVTAGLDDSFVVRADMTDPNSILAMVEATQAHYGRIDVLVNNAGRGMIASIEQLDLTAYLALISLNVTGPLIAMQAVIPIMREQGSGAIVNISSGLSKMAIPYLGGYASTKYALNALSLTARGELASAGIVVTVVHPGLTATDFGANAVRTGNSDWRPRAGSIPEPDPVELVAERIKEAIENGPSEQYMSDQQRRGFEEMWQSFK